MPDTMAVTMEHSEGLLFNWTSGFGNARLGEAENVLGSDGSLHHDWTSLRYVPEQVNRPGAHEEFSSPPGGQHMQNFLDCVRTGRTPNCPPEIGFRAAVACRMAVESYRQRRTVRWDSLREQIV